MGVKRSESVVESSAPRGAVFLSYAREDAAAARRIADALHGFGVEVWFDQSELRGGDAWDQKLRRQIKECALFVPVVSANTQERREGYFRLEWKLAAERTHLMAEGVPFIAPVVIDETAEASALVPAEFMRVQWTRLRPAGNAGQALDDAGLEAFCEQVKRLLAPPEIVGRGRRTPPQGERGRAPEPAGFGDPALQQSRSHRPGLGWAALAVCVVGLGAAFLLNRKPEPLATPTKPVGEKQSAVAASVVNAKSIAVLPCETRSDEKGNEFFTDGIHDNILTSLTNIGQLQVVSRTSVLEYRGTKKKIPQIARELNVAFVLEGSVQRAGSAVRITGHLIRAATDEHVWAKDFDHELSTAGIFAMQSELAQAIAGELKAAISPHEKNLLARRPTENLAALDLYLKARAVTDRTRADLGNRESWLQAAVNLDPNFALAWAELANVHLEFKVVSFDTTTARLAKAKDAVDRATALAPDSPEVLRAGARYSTAGTGDYVRATEQLHALLRLQPNDTETRHALGLAQLAQGRWPEAIASWRTVALLDPSNPRYASDLVRICTFVRRYDEAIAEQRRLMALQPGQLANDIDLARLAFLATGSRREGDELLARLEAIIPPPPEVVRLRMVLTASRGDYTEYLRLDRENPLTNSDRGKQKGAGLPGEGRAIGAAEVLRAQGDMAGARARLGDLPARLRAELEREPRNTQLLRTAAQVEAILGNKKEALRRIAQAAEIYPESGGTIGAAISVARASVLALTGDKDRAIEEIARLLRTPSTLNIHVLKLDLSYASLRGDPRFEALVNDPKNNQPLF